MVEGMQEHSIKSMTDKQVRYNSILMRIVMNNVYKNGTKDPNVVHCLGCLRLKSKIRKFSEYASYFGLNIRNKKFEETVFLNK